MRPRSPTTYIMSTFSPCLWSFLDTEWFQVLVLGSATSGKQFSHAHSNHIRYLCEIIQCFALPMLCLLSQSAALLHCDTSCTPSLPSPSPLLFANVWLSSLLIIYLVVLSQRCRNGFQNVRDLEPVSLSVVSMPLSSSCPCLTLSLYGI